MRIGIDIMGGDFAPEATVLGAILAVAILRLIIQTLYGIWTNLIGVIGVVNLYFANNKKPLIKPKKYL